MNILDIVVGAFYTLCAAILLMWIAAPETLDCIVWGVC